MCVCVTSKMAACTIKELKTRLRLEKRQNETGKVYLNPLNSFILCVCVCVYKHKGWEGTDGPARFWGCQHRRLCYMRSREIRQSISFPFIFFTRPILKIRVIHIDFFFLNVHRHFLGEKKKKSPHHFYRSRNVLTAITIKRGGKKKKSVYI